MDNKERFKFEWELFKNGLVYMFLRLLQLAILIGLMTGFYIVFSIISIKRGILIDSPSVVVCIAMVAAGITYKFGILLIVDKVKRFFRRSK